MGILVRHFAVLLFFANSHLAFSQLTANFSASPTAGCSPFCVNFTDLSTGGPTSWTWNFGDGSAPSVLKNPSHCYFLPGVYTVTLTISNGSTSNTIVKPALVLVYNKPQANFTLNPFDTACVGQKVTFTDATIISAGGPPIKKYDWDFGDGVLTSVTTTTTTHVYTTPGTYPVSLIVTDTNGCTGVINKPNAIVVIDPVASFSASPTSSCKPPLSVTFTNTSPSAGSSASTWFFGDGSSSTLSNPVHTYTASGTYSVTLVINQHGCRDTIVKLNYISIQNIAPSFTTTPSAVCTGNPVTFTSTSVPAAVSASWIFGDGGTSSSLNPTHTYTASGTYTVTLIATDARGCTDTVTSVFTVNLVPVANFTADTLAACSVPFTVTFGNTSTGGTNYTWTFGDGGSSTAQNPAHTYTAAGTYTVSMIAVNSAGGCSDTITKNAYINIFPPMANFLHFPDSGCVPLTVNFTNTSTSLVDPVATYSWTFGDGTTSNAPGPSHTYTATGVYSVTLIIETGNGCIDTFTCVNCIRVGTKPLAGFTFSPDTICYGLPVQFTDTSVGPLTGWLWVFGDGQMNTSQNPSHVYGDTGTFQPFLIAYNNGCADTALLQNMVVLPPKALLTYSLNCTNYYSVAFTSISAGADSVFWDFGDGSMDSSNSINVVHTYPSRGPFTVTLTAYNYTTACNNVTSQSFTIAEPIASYTVANGCYPHTANFVSTSQDANTFYWNFGNPATSLDTSLSANPSYTYNLPGAYSVTFIITDVNGCRDTLVDTVKSLGPYPYFSADTLRGCRPLIVTFSDTSVTDSLLTQWTWNFGDGTPLLVTNTSTVSHTYTTTGVFSITMAVRDTNGCVKTITKNSYIQCTFPTPAFTVDTFACKGDLLTYNAGATTVVGGTYFWNFGDGTGDTTTATTTTHAYGSDNLYVVSLTVVDINGCSSTITHNVRILKPAANFYDSILVQGCKTLQVMFLDSSQGYVNQWQWSFGNGATSTIQNPSYTYTQPGYFNVTLIVTNAGGCMDTVTIDSLFVPGPIGTFSFGPTAGCNPLTVCFTANSANSDQYIWDFGDGTVVTSTADTICHTYVTPGSFNPTMIMQNTLPNGNPCLDQAPNLTGLVTVTNVINVTLAGPSSISVPQDSIISTAVTFSGGVPPYTYSWSPATGLNCDTCTSVMIAGTGDTILYTFIIYDSAGCLGKVNVLIFSEPCFEEKLIPNVFSPNGDERNDLFYVPGVCSNENYSLQIYDRWGVLLFATTQRNNGWDGRNSSGVEVRNGVYYYVITLANMRDQKGLPIDDMIYKGFVHLTR